MGRHSFDAVWAVPPQQRSRRSAFVGIGAASLGIIILVVGFIWLNTPLPDRQNGGSGTTTARTTETAATTGTTTSVFPTTGSASPVVLPVTVLNNSPVDGLAARVAAVLEANGWPIAQLLNYSETQVPATTAFFTPGIAAEEAAARAMVAQFPQISGGAEPRFGGLNGSGLTLAAIGDWVP